MKILCPLMLAASALPLLGSGVELRAMFGVVTDRQEISQDGVRVYAVRPGSPAMKAGVQEGDVLTSLAGEKVADRNDFRAVLRRLVPGQQIEVDLLRDGQALRLPVTLVERPARRGASRHTSVETAVRGDRMMRPMSLNPEIRKSIEENRKKVVQQLRMLAHSPESFSPHEVSEYLQAIRNAAQASRKPDGEGHQEWMGGVAGEVTLRFKDAEGIIQLQGASRELQLTEFAPDGREKCVYPINTPEERAALPLEVVERLGKL